MLHAIWTITIKLNPLLTTNGQVHIAITDIMRQFSPSLKGASARTLASEDSFDADLNVAFLGASARFVIKNK